MIDGHALAALAASEGVALLDLTPLADGTIAHLLTPDGRVRRERFPLTDGDLRSMAVEGIYAPSGLVESALLDQSVLRGVVEGEEERIRVTPQAEFNPQLIEDWYDSKRRVDAAIDAWGKATEALLQRLSALTEPLAIWLLAHTPSIPLVVSAGGILSVLPWFAAAADNVTPFAERFSITQVPGFAMYDFLRKRGPTQPTSLGLVFPPLDPDLYFSRREVAWVQRRLGLTVRAERQVEALFGEEARGAAHLHISTHGVTYLSHPLLSGLNLNRADGLVEVQLAELLDRLDCPECDLAVLTACQTGQAAAGNVDNKSLGLSLAFLAAGARRVWSTLWSVNELSTALLLTKAYALREDGATAAAALTGARRWLRTSDRIEILHWLNAELRNSDEYKDRVLPLGKIPFASPLYWAAFRHEGLF
ncbi:hypothetical protein BH11ARM2_BH11ARM2_27350 [soil metagenome]